MHFYYVNKYRQSVNAKSKDFQAIPISKYSKQQKLNTKM